MSFIRTVYYFSEMIAIEQIILRQLLEDVKNEKISIDAALNKIKNLPFEDLGFAMIDHHRALRKGFPEVVFCQGKTVEQIVRIFEGLCAGNRSVLGTRATKKVFWQCGNYIQTRYIMSWPGRL
jgi:NCAIR mutase (PurE)-related protein